MLGLRRPNVDLPTLRADGRGGRAAEEIRQIRIADPTGAVEFAPHWRRPDVLGALYAMQGWVCAYCQRRIDPRDRGHVDHFRPKRFRPRMGARTEVSAGYWWLAYSFDNYFLACSQCNERKGERFALEEHAPRATYTTRHALPEEACLLVDPARDPADHWMRVHIKTEDDDPSPHGHVVARPLPASSVPTQRVEHTVCVFRLNEDIDHLQDRLRLIEKLTDMHRRGKHRKLQRRAIRYRGHALTARCFLEELAPELLPDPKSELHWFLRHLCKRLNAAIGVRKRSPRPPPSRARRERELAWTLAVLWKDPPAGSPDDVAILLDQMKCRRRVERYYKQLG